MGPAVGGRAWLRAAGRGVGAEEMRTGEMRTGGRAGADAGGEAGEAGGDVAEAEVDQAEERLERVVAGGPGGDGAAEPFQDAGETLCGVGGKGERYHERS